jgi:hypothetical protein
MACRESSVDFLRSLGYTTLLLPRERIAPLDLVGRLPGGRARQLGSLTRLVVGDAAPPLTTRDERVAQLTGRHTDALDVGVALRLLLNFLAALAPITVTLEGTLARARKVEFSYEDVRSDAVDLIDLRRWLGRHPALDYTNPVVDDYFIGEGEVVVITRVLKSASFGIVALDEEQRRLEVDLTAQRRKLAEAGIKVSSDERLKVTFTGPTPLVFAFQGFRLHIDTKGLQVSDDVSPEMGLMAVTGPVVAGGPRPVVLNRHGLLALD